MTISFAYSVRVRGFYFPVCALLHFLSCMLKGGRRNRQLDIAHWSGGETDRIFINKTA